MNFSAVLGWFKRYPSTRIEEIGVPYEKAEMDVYKILVDYVIVGGRALVENN